MTNYNAQQKNFYSNLIYQSIIDIQFISLEQVLSFVYDKYNEEFRTSNYKRSEVSSRCIF